MPELAYNNNGDPVDVGNRATNWKVFRMAAKGPPGIVYRDGVPWRPPIEIGIDEFRNGVGGIAARYRLHAIDAEGQPLDVPAAYVQLDDGEGDDTAAPMPVRDARDEVLVQLLRSQSEARRAQAEMFARVVDANVEMAKAASELIRAADGAGLPTRQPTPAPEPVYVEVPSDDGERAPSQTDWLALINTLGQIVPILCDPKGLGSLWDMLRGRGGGGGSQQTSPRAAQTPRASSPRSAPAASAPRPASRPSAPPPPSARADGNGKPAPAPVAQTSSVELEVNASNHAEDVAMHSAPEDAAASAETLPAQAKNLILHLKAIQDQLTPDEWKLCEVVLRDMPLDERAQWRDQLMALSVNDAVTVIRSAIAASEDGGAS